MPINPKKFFSIIIAILAAALFALLVFFCKINPVISYLISVNIVTFVIYGYDKRQAAKAGLRVPEVVLHAIALVGGSPGALAGQLTFRHKTRKIKFVIVFWAIVILQIVVLFLLREPLLEMLNK